MFYSVSSKTQLFQNKNCMLKKNRKFMKNSGLFLNMAKWCFGGLFFQALMLLWFVFCVSGIVAAKVLKMPVFPVFWAFLAWLILVYLGLEDLGIFVVLVFGFSFVQVLLFVCLFKFWFCLCFVVGVVLVFFFVFVFCFSFFVFFRGFKGQVRWPKGSPHLALNPPYFLFVFCFCCYSLLFFFGFNRKRLFFTLRKGIFVYLSVSPFLSLLPFWASPFFTFSFFVSLLFFLFFLSFLFLISVSGSCFLFFFYLFLFQDVILFMFFCLLSCFVLNQNISCVFPLHLVFYCCCFFVFVALVVCYFLISGNLSKTSLKKWKFQKQQKWKMRKK